MDMIKVRELAPFHEQFNVSLETCSHQAMTSSLKCNKQRQPDGVKDQSLLSGCFGLL